MRNLLLALILTCLITTGCTQSKYASCFTEQNLKSGSVVLFAEFEQVAAIRASKQWAEKGYNFNPYAMTAPEMAEKAKWLDQAAHWKAKVGVDFPITLTYHEMNDAGEQLWLLAHSDYLPANSALKSWYPTHRGLYYERQRSVNYNRMYRDQRMYRNHRTHHNSRTWRR